MKGVIEISPTILLEIAVLSLLFIIILFILCFFDVICPKSIVTFLCRTLCFPAMAVVDTLLKSILVGYLVSPSSMCGFCG